MKARPLNPHLPPSIRSHIFLLSEIPTGSDQDFTLEDAFVSEGMGLTAALRAPGRNAPLCRLEEATAEKIVWGVLFPAQTELSSNSPPTVLVLLDPVWQ